MHHDPADDWDDWCASMTLALDDPDAPYRREEPPAREGDFCAVVPEEDITW